MYSMPPTGVPTTYAYDQVNRLTQAGFEFKHGDLKVALNSLLG